MSDTASPALTLNLSGEQLTQVVDALATVFLPADLTQMLLRRLGKTFANYLQSAKYSHNVYYMVSDARENDWLAKLLAAALDEKPGDARLTALWVSLGGGRSKGGPNLEVQILDRSRMADLQWTLQTLRWVCRIQAVGNGKRMDGSGILVAPDLVLTNMHVLEGIDECGGMAKASVIFDHLGSGVEWGEGRPVRLDTKWRPPNRGYNAEDGMENQSQKPAADELDYAVLRLAAQVGNEPVGDPLKAATGAPSRGWFELPDPAQRLPRVPVPPGSLTIFQYPQKQGSPPQHLQYATGSVQVSPYDNRVRYDALTRGGSSGSPCFDEGFDLVALHHASETRADEKDLPRFNQGIPMAAILQDLLNFGADFAAQGSQLPWTFVNAGPPSPQPPLPPQQPHQPGQPPAPPVSPPSGIATDDVVLGRPPRVAFVNRFTFRSHLKQLWYKEVDHRIVAVSGEPKSGKSHSRHLVEHVASAADIACVYFDAAVSQPMEDACEFLADQMGFSGKLISEMKNSALVDKADPARTGRKFATWLARTTADLKPKRWWLMIDGLHPNNNPDSNLKTHLVGGLLEAARTNNAFTQVILFLLGSGVSNDTVLVSRTLEDKLEPIRPEDIENFLDRFAASKGRRLRPEERASILEKAVGGGTQALSTQQMDALQAQIQRVIAVLPL